MIQALGTWRRPVPPLPDSAATPVEQAVSSSLENDKQALARVQHELRDTKSELRVANLKRGILKQQVDDLRDLVRELVGRIQAWASLLDAIEKVRKQGKLSESSRRRLKKILSPEQMKAFDKTEDLLEKLQDLGNAATVRNPGAAPTVVDPGAAPTVVDPGAAPTVVDPGDAPTVADPGDAPTVADPDADAWTMPGPSAASTVPHPGNAPTAAAAASQTASALTAAFRTAAAQTGVASQTPASRLAALRAAAARVAAAPKKGAQYRGPRPPSARPPA